MSAYQGLRPWLRSLALRAKTELVFLVYQKLHPWQRAFALRAETEGSPARHRGR